MIPLVVIEADVAATDNKVLGSVPNFLPATALIPICDPMVGLDAMLGIIVIPDDFLFGASAGLPGCNMLRIRSPKSYCLYKVSVGLAGCTTFSLMRSESAFTESEGACTWAKTGVARLVNTMSKTAVKSGIEILYDEL